MTSDCNPGQVRTHIAPVTSAEQYAYVLSAFDTARVYENQAEPGVGSCLDELRRRTVVTSDQAMGPQLRKSRWSAIKSVNWSSLRGYCH
jgi:hypothetical protein